MSRANRGEEDAVGQDSFLDVIANIVGILILLVMVVGSQASRIEAVVGGVKVGAQGPSEADLQTAYRDAQDSIRNFHQLAAKGEAVVTDVVLREAERDTTATFVMELEAKIAEERDKLSEGERRDFDLQRSIGEAQLELDTLTRRQIAASTIETEVTEIESLPTPLAETVTGDEVHLRLAGGYVAVAPIAELVELAKQDMESNLWRLQNRDAMEAIVGPINGFRMRYGLAKGTVNVVGRGSATLVKSVGFELDPESPVMGIPVAEALEPDSPIAVELARHRAQRTTVTVWTYPDSFAEFRDLKKRLFEWGYATAARPLPAGVPIGGSPNGSKSSAQ